jgi:hypothetical protein
MLRDASPISKRNRDITNGGTNNDIESASGFQQAIKVRFSPLWAQHLFALCRGARSGSARPVGEYDRLPHRRSPGGGGAGKLFTIGGQPINSRLEAYYNVVKPDAAPNWQMVFTWQFLFPK